MSCQDAPNETKPLLSWPCTAMNVLLSRRTGYLLADILAIRFWPGIKQSGALASNNEGRS